MGQLDLAIMIDNPWKQLGMRGVRENEIDFLINVPIAPIAYRRDFDDQVTPLGAKYEALVEINCEIKKRLEAEGFDGRDRTLYASDGMRLTRQLIDIIGLNAPEMEGSMGLPDSQPRALLPLLFRMIRSFDTNLSFIARASLLTVEITARI